VSYLQNKVAANDDLIQRLRERIGVLEHRLRIVLTEVKRERENPLPEHYVAKTRFAPSAQVLQVAPKNSGHDTVVVSAAGGRCGVHFCIRLVSYCQITRARSWRNRACASTTSAVS